MGGGVKGMQGEGREGLVVHGIEGRMLGNYREGKERCSGVSGCSKRL